MGSSTSMLGIFIAVVAVLFMAVVGIYIYLAKKRNNKKTKYLKELVITTQENKFSPEIFYQKFYLFCISVPFLKRYTEKLRRRIEIINLGDEYLTRTQTAKILLKIIPLVLICAIVIVIFSGKNYLLMVSLLLLLIFLIETLISGSVDKVENTLLKQQLDFFAEIRHAYHEYNMVEEAIYDVAQNDEMPEVSRQAERIHEILLSDDPESELEKYYDIAPNDFLKEFAGISYLTREFGDRKDENGASLYLKNLNNITQEMQIEILKRDKLDYVFQSLSVIALLPVLFIEVMKNWAVGTFPFTKQFYNGKLGLMVQIFLIILTIASYILVRKLKDNTKIDNVNSTSNPWQNKLYKIPWVKKFVDLFIPKEKTKEYRQKIKLLKDSASKMKIEWMYVNKICFFIGIFLLTLTMIIWSHMIAKNYVYTEPTADFNIVGNLGNVDDKEAIAKTARQNIIIDKIKNHKKLQNETEVIKLMDKTKEFSKLTETQKEKEAKQILDKTKIITGENFSWFELLIALSLAFLAYYIPEFVLKFQYKMRQLEMENEVMQYHTIILMLMKIERVNVEMMLEWIERYSNIFRDPIAKCVNNFESGPYEALEQLKQDISFPKLIRIVESLQAAVDQIPIKEAFDELETERAYYQERRRESNERLIAKKARIGKVIGFAPMVTLFVGYLIIPLVGIGIFSMGEALSVMESAATK